MVPGEIEPVRPDLPVEATVAANKLVAFEYVECISTQQVCEDGHCCLLVPGLRAWVAENDRVVTRWTARGTHRGDFMGIPPSGQHGAITDITFDRVTNGRVAECWTNSDDLGLLRQIGAIPEVGPAGER